MNTITIPKKEYNDLVEKKFRYEHLRRAMEEDIFASPPSKNINETISAFEKTGKYNQGFIESLKKGLNHSSYFKK